MKLKKITDIKYMALKVKPFLQCSKAGDMSYAHSTVMYFMTFFFFLWHQILNLCD